MAGPSDFPSLKPFLAFLAILHDGVGPNAILKDLKKERGSFQIISPHVLQLSGMECMDCSVTLANRSEAVAKSFGDFGIALKCLEIALGNSGIALIRLYEGGHWGASGNLWIFS